MKMTLWKIKCERDCDCYSIRSRTKKGAIALYNESRDESSGGFYADVIQKLVYEFKDSFDLADSIMSEDRGDWNLVESREYPLK